MKVLGITDSHCSSVCLLEDGNIRHVLQEERLTRVKNQGGYPTNAISTVLEWAGLNLDDIDMFVMDDRQDGYNPPNDRGLYIKKYSKYFKQDDTTAIPNAITNAKRAVGKMAREVGLYEGKLVPKQTPLLEAGVPARKIRIVDHHTAHAAASLFGFTDLNKDALVLTYDSRGGPHCATVNTYKNRTFEKVSSIPHPYSICRLYSIVTYMLGMVPLEHEYKLMGMAPYASDSSTAREVCDYFHSLMSFDKDNPLLLRLKDREKSFIALAPEFARKFKFTRFDHLSAGVQLFTEEVILEWVKRAISSTGLNRLSLSGGLFMNVKMNKRIAEMPEVKSVTLCPSAGDESISIGAAYLGYDDMKYIDSKRYPGPNKHIYWGNEYTDDEIKQAIDKFEFSDEINITQHKDMADIVSDLLIQHKIGARFDGRMEFGARALGNRSIMANPSSSTTIHRLNKAIKQRDFWMPFAASVLEEKADMVLDVIPGTHSPFMMISYDTNPEINEKILAATHPFDGTCRPHIVSSKTNPRYHKIINKFYEKTSVPMILNTSFNLHGFPLVMSPEHALDVLDKSGLDYLAIGGFLIEKKT
jgi:carbamoyltransferase